MTFTALLTKELRLRFRRERSIWVIIFYILMMGLLGWFLINAATSSPSNGNLSLDRIGLYLYNLLAVIQLFLVMFITPAFTATAINGEKERQTYDLLICSRLSPFSLAAGKLVAGLTHALLLIAASIPIFSLVFFFGGVSPAQMLSALLVFVATALLTGSFGLFCSIIFSRPAISTVITYVVSSIWLIFPLAVSYLWSIVARQVTTPNQITLLFPWTPVSALISTFPTSGSSLFATLALGKAKVGIWQPYILFSLVASIIFFLLSAWAIRPAFSSRFLQRFPFALSKASSITSDSNQSTAGESEEQKEPEKTETTKAPLEAEETTKPATSAEERQEGA